jgi:hypothetical protein
MAKAAITPCHVFAFALALHNLPIVEQQVRRLAPATAG